MSDNSPLKIRTMADDLEKAEKGEVSFASPVSDISAPLKIEKKFSSHISKPSVSEKKEKKSLKDVLVQLGESDNNLEPPGTGKNKEAKKEGTEDENKDRYKSDLKDLLSQMENLSRKRPAPPSAPFSPPSSSPSASPVLTPSLPPQEESGVEAQKEIKKEEIKKEVGIKESQFYKLPKEEKPAVEREARKSESIRETKEEMSLLRDQKMTREEILKIEKELEERKEKLEEIKERKKAREEGEMKKSGIISFTKKEKSKSGGEALKEIEKKAAEEISQPAKETYLSPEARLLYNKPEHRSSVLNKVKEKNDSPEISKIEKTFKNQKPFKEKKKLEPDKEYKLFKRNLKGKYRAISAEKMSKRLVFGLVAIMIIGISAVFVWFLVLKKSPEGPLSPVSEMAAVEEIEEFSSINDEIVINSGKGEDTGLAAKINAKAARLEREGRMANILRVAVKKEGAAVPLKELLEELKIEMPGDTLDFFDNNRYNLILFKEKSGVKRLGLALATNNPSTARLKFQSWENENIASRKIYRAFEPLFLGSRLSVIPRNKFKTGEYLGVKMRYLQIPDQNTSFDYLIYGNIIVVTTSKDSIFQMIEILISS